MTWQFRRTRSIYEVAESQRAKLLRDEQRAVNQITRSYRVAESAIQEELAQVLAKMTAAMDAGQAVTPAWVYQEARLKTLLAEVDVQLAKYSGDAQAITQAQQLRNVMTAGRYAADLVGAAGVRSGFVMLHDQAFTDIVGFLSDGSPLHALFKEIGPQAVGNVRKAFAKGMALGKNPRVVGRWIHDAVNDDLKMSHYRGVLIARNETMRAYRTSTLRNYQANSQIVQGWRWLSGRDGRCCPICIAMDGSVHPLSEPFASHVGCRCSSVPVLREGLDTNIGTGEEWLRGQSEATQVRVMQGKSRWELWHDQDVKLTDMVRETTSAKWGPGRALVPLRELGG